MTLPAYRSDLVDLSPEIIKEKIAQANMQIKDPSTPAEKRAFLVRMLNFLQTKQKSLPMQQMPLSMDFQPRQGTSMGGTRRRRRARSRSRRRR